MAFLAQVEGGGQPGRPGAHHRHFFPRVRRAPAGLLPAPPAAVGGIALQRADRDRLVHLAAAAGLFARVNADPPQNAGQRDLLPDDGIGLIPPALGNHPHVARDIDVGRTGGLARHQVFLAFPGPHAFIGEGAGRADVDAGRAELAPGGFQAIGQGSHLNPAAGVDHETDGLDAPQIPAGPHTARAADAEVVIALEQRVALDDGEIGGRPLGRRGRNADVVNDVLKLAKTEPRAAALVLRHVGGALRAAASFLLGAGEAGMRVPG